MSRTYSVDLKTIVESHNLTPVNLSDDYEQVKITTWDVTRPGLPFAGFYDYFDPTRVQIMGKLEATYLKDMAPEARLASIRRYMSTGVRFLVVAHGMPVPPEMLEEARRNNVCLFTTEQSTSDFMAQLSVSLNIWLAPRTTVHGVLMEIHGEGVLITGESGVGKSENAMALLRRGHRLVADDAVEIRRISDSLYGSAPEIIRHYIEIRGIGIIDVQQLFGMGAVQFDSDIEIVIHLEPWQDGKFYDRLGLEGDTYTILGVQLPYVTIPVRPGRNLAGIVEIAAMKNRQMRYGYNSARDFMTQFDQKMDELARQAKEKQ